MITREEITMNRFETLSVSGNSYTSISCAKGSAWVTAGKGFSDIILKAGQDITLISKGMIVIEALSDCKISICARNSEEFKQNVMEN